MITIKELILNVVELQTDGVEEDEITQVKLLKNHVDLLHSMYVKTTGQPITAEPLKARPGVKQYEEIKTTESSVDLEKIADEIIAKEGE